MQCDNCGKILDESKEKTFCTGCGASVSANSSVKKESNDKNPQRYAKRVAPVGIRSLEVEIRARALFIGAFGGFVASFVLFSLIDIGGLLAFLLAAVVGCVAGVAFMTFIAKSAPSVKSSFNDFASALPIGAKVKNLVRSVSSALPFIGPLRED